MYTPLTVDFFFSLEESLVTPTNGNQPLGPLSSRPVLRVIGDTSIQVPIYYCRTPQVSGENLSANMNNQAHDLWFKYLEVITVKSCLYLRVRSTFKDCWYAVSCVSFVSSKLWIVYLITFVFWFCQKPENPMHTLCFFGGMHVVPSVLHVNYFV